MSTVTSIFTRRPTAPNREQQARDRVRERLAGRVAATILAQALARAVRSVVGGRSVDDAVRSACAWALSANHSDDPLPPAA